MQQARAFSHRIYTPKKGKKMKSKKNQRVTAGLAKVCDIGLKGG
jgi:hypothetical protein